MHTAVHIVRAPPESPPWFPEPGTVTVEAVGSLKAHGIDHLARLLERVLQADPACRAAVVVYAHGGLIYIRDATGGALMADLFPAEARALIRKGLIRIQHSLER